MTIEENFPVPQELIPHRYPFLFLDKIVEHRKGFLRAVKCITYNEAFFQGHFPTVAIVPGVLLVEMMAQASAALYRLDHFDPSDEKGSPAPGRLATIEKVRFIKEVHPGDRLVIETALKHQIANMAKFEASISVEVEVVATGSLITVL